MPPIANSPPATINRWQRYLRLSKFIAHCLICPAVLLTLPLHRRYIKQLSGWWYKRLLKILNIRLHIQGALPNTAVLGVSNHVSWLDIVIYGSTLQPAFVSKAEIEKWPIIGSIARAIGTVFLPRGAFKTEQTSNVLAATLKSGRSVMLFPESTTSDAAIPERFHARLFAAALDHQFPVQPIALHYLPEHKNAHGHHPWAPWIDDASLGGHLARLLRLKQLDVRVTVCALIEPKGYDRSGLAKASHSAIVAALS